MFDVHEICIEIMSLILSHLRYYLTIIYEMGVQSNIISCVTMIKRENYICLFENVFG